MKTKTKGYEITDVPGLDRIIVEPSEDSEYGVHVVLIGIYDDEPRSYGVDELGELEAAIGAAHRLAQTLANEIAANSDD